MFGGKGTRSQRPEMEEDVSNLWLCSPLVARENHQRA